MKFKLRLSRAGPATKDEVAGPVFFAGYSLLSISSRFAMVLPRAMIFPSGLKRMR